MGKISKNLREMSEGDLEKKLADLREEVRLDRFKMEGAKSKNVKEVKEIKKEIARVLTLLAERNKK